MKKFIKNIGVETFWSGTFALLTAIVIVIEMASARFESSAIISGIKDFLGVLVTIIMLTIAVNELRPKKEEPFSFENELTKALNQWINNHSNMIVKTARMPQNHINDFGMSMTTDVNRFYDSENTLKSSGGGAVGRFLRITEIKKDLYMKNDASMTFFFNSQTYCITDDETKFVKELENVAKNISTYVKSVVKGIKISEPKKEDDRTVTVSVTFDAPIITENSENIGLVTTVLDRMYEAMLVSAVRK